MWANNAMRVLDRQVLQYEIAAVDVEHCSSDIVRSISERIIPLRKFDTGPPTALPAKRNEARVNSHLLVVQAVLDENDQPLEIVVWHGVDRFLNSLEVTTAVARNYHVGLDRWSSLVLCEDKPGRE